MFKNRYLMFFFLCFDFQTQTWVELLAICTTSNYHLATNPFEPMSDCQETNSMSGWQTWLRFTRQFGYMVVSLPFWGLSRIKPRRRAMRCLQLNRQHFQKFKGVWVQDQPIKKLINTMGTSPYSFLAIPKPRSPGSLPTRLSQHPWCFLCWLGGCPHREFQLTCFNDVLKFWLIWSIFVSTTSMDWKSLWYLSWEVESGAQNPVTLFLGNHQKSWIDGPKYLCL